MGGIKQEEKGKWRILLARALHLQLFKNQLSRAVPTCLQHSPHPHSGICTAGAPSQLLWDNFQTRGANFSQHPQDDCMRLNLSELHNGHIQCFPMAYWKEASSLKKLSFCGLLGHKCLVVSLSSGQEVSLLPCHSVRFPAGWCLLLCIH